MIHTVSIIRSLTPQEFIMATICEIHPRHNLEGYHTQKVVEITEECEAIHNGGRRVFLIFTTPHLEERSALCQVRVTDQNEDTQISFGHYLPWPPAQSQFESLPSKFQMDAQVVELPADVLWGLMEQFTPC